jgi:sugar phosphate isomerase/epimerase
LTIENKPFLGRNCSRCTGSSPEEIEFVMHETGVSFCLDLGHAICSANAQNVDPMTYLDAFLALKPVWYHLSDGETGGVKDRHLHFGAGSYDMLRILAKIPRPRYITIETEKDSRNRLDDFEADIRYLRRIVAVLDTAGWGGARLREGGSLSPSAW